MNAVAEMPAPLLFTDNAANKVRELIEEEGNNDLKLRVFVSGGGCSGFQYHFELDDKAAGDDLVIEQDGIKVLIDATSLEFLQGAELDYADELIGAAFKVGNPNAKSSCGCGTSFSI